MASFRSPENKKRYDEYSAALPAGPACLLCEKPSLKEFTHWRIVENIFPYDLVAKVSHMIIPSQHKTESDLTDVEEQEFKDIKINYLQNQYDYILENTHKNKSLPHHFHLHILVGKDTEYVGL